MVVATRCRKAPGPTSPRAADLAAHPSEEELITSFLRPRVLADYAGGGAPCAFIHDADVYSADPDDLTRAFGPALASNGDAAWYFFSVVRAKTRDGQRKARTVESGEGCWHSEAGAKPVVDEAGRCLGHRQSFSFVTKVDGRRVRSGWLMVELGLDDADDVALCKVYFSPRARHGAGGPSAAGRKRKAAAAADDRNPASPRQRRRARPTEASASHDDDDVTADGAEVEQSTQGGSGVVAGESTAGGDSDEELWTGGSFFSWWMRNRDRLLVEYGIVDRSDEELLKTLGLDVLMKDLTYDLHRHSHGGIDCVNP
ncbi:hypothetical protein BAE44_0021746 [Dichanthelium oligosanthes]|uniref:NAC domain-containing protein n=1 Tax=Dichanthelium oligosanthes TaxID=888268 RepID=A0A1E5UWT4_9POAL|nr:hypothetical protein BAE44_0021746 [Dichanthelium oligosanthes]